MNSCLKALSAALPFVFLTSAFFASGAQAEYVTPGFGFNYSMDQLVAQSGGAVTGSEDSYQVNDSVVISQGDRLDIAPGMTLMFMDTSGNIGLEINGGLRALGTEGNPILLTGSTTTPGSWRGLDFTNTTVNSEFHLTHVEIAYADIAVDVFGGDVLLENCDIHHCLDKAVDISSANGVITNCHLHHNQQRTVTMTLTSSPTFENCVLDHNNLENSSPYPYFNVGLQGVNSPTIRGCLIDGSGIEMSGGMAFWSSSNALVENNTITGCGYGILCYSTGANPLIYNNRITDNNIHPDTLNWGFGVACNGNNAPILAGNHIQGHGYGVAAINGGHPNLGDLVNDFPGDDGLNIFHDNGLGDDIFAFYNNTPLAQMAQNNIWGSAGTLEEAENNIFHQLDDPTLGLVTFDPLGTAALAPVDQVPPVLTDVIAYPNPFNPQVEIKMNLGRESHVSAVVLDIAGRLVQELQTGMMSAGPQVLVWDGNDRRGKASASGVYFYRLVVEKESRLGKLVLVR